MRMINFAPLGGFVMDDSSLVVGGQRKERVWNRPLVAGVISGIFVLVFIQPILSFLWRFLLSNITSLVNSACHQAALGYTDVFSFWIMGTIISLSVGIVTGFATGRVLRAYGKTRSAPRTLSPRLSAVLSVVFAIGATLSGTVQMTKYFVVMQLKASFYQRLAVLAPKISEQEHKEYLASWAAMRNEEDYRRIVESMEANAKKSGTTLPELLSGARVSD
jgi:hypothetical protein